MPELPEVETTMRALEARLLGRRFAQIVQRRDDLRFALPERLPERLAGATIQSFGRRAKYILVELSSNETLILHLGMSGRLLFDGDDGRKHEHLTFRFDDKTILRFIDPRRFGMLDLTASHSLAAHRWLAHLGLEPLNDEFSGRVLALRLAGKQSAIKTAIMDQRIVVGVGNIYASESLFLAGISPTHVAGSVGRKRVNKLAKAIREVLLKAIDAGGSSLRDYVQSDGELGNFQRFFSVYGREERPCVTCATPVRRIVQTGRTTFFCPKCQR